MPDTPQITIATFYAFRPQPDAELTARTEQMEARAAALGIRGLVIYGREGINTTLSGAEENLRQYIAAAREICELDTDFEIKLSQSTRHPFHTFKVKIRDEIVTLGNAELVPVTKKNHHLPPEEWNRVLNEEPEVVVLDTRNWYETRIGKFKKAVDPMIEEFQEFPAYLEKSGISKDQKVLIYCTGGIRCEKAILEMDRQGFHNVWQLDGGILAYLEKFPEQNFEGECFVFDHRVAVDQKLQPTHHYTMCPHCGQPADQEIQCVRCDSAATICVRCFETQQHRHTCTKNCAHHFALAPGRKGKPQRQGKRFTTLGSRSQNNKI